MIPLKDNIPTRTTPVVNYVIIALCAVIFLLQLGDESDGRASIVERFGMIPARVGGAEQIVVNEPVRQMTPFGERVVMRPRRLEASPVPAWMTLLTSMFLHGGFLHILGNMWFLWIFGDNIEDRLGHGGYALFYVGGGLVANLFHLVTNLGSTMPTIGASGAIAAVMGAYLLLYPRARVLTLVPIFFFIQLLVLPAALFLGVWFALQLFQGTVSLGSTEAGGVAWWAHIGGFVFGAGVAWILSRTDHLRAAPERVVFAPRRVQIRRHPGEPDTWDV